ncbi:F-box/WD-40 repeat-containing protein At3g52030 isoform X2 [Quercus robur]|uniref:F-box/WD-40 repeat-containing protein At3g52030 isoform X2 n=1 Tax=Quercus robur TaxID=38942 RepID=UPI002162A023|nr:F-box/WD-40 repeat-containing protein At3g52030 isoform X2 [Quercus robur]
MGPTPSSSNDRSERRKRNAKTTIQSLEPDTLCMIFALLDFFDLVRCSAVCKYWNTIINKSKLLREFYAKQKQNSTEFSNKSTCSETSLKTYLEELAMEHHRVSLQEGLINIDQWKGHSVGFNQCRMKMGLILTGKGDKIVGLVGTRICIWRRNGKRSIFPSNEGTFVKGLCMRGNQRFQCHEILVGGVALQNGGLKERRGKCYCATLSYNDPEAVVGCEDGTARLFDMYSRKCSRIIRMRAGPVTCLCLSDDQLILSGSSLGSITVSGILSDQQVATLRSRITIGGIKTLCYNACSHLVFAGSTSGYTSCWDLRTMRSLWETRVSPNVVYSVQHLRSDKSTLVVGGIDGVLRTLDQNTGQVLASCVMEGNALSSSQNTYGATEKRKGRRLSEGTPIDSIPKSARPPITCLAVGMKKVVTAHNGRHIRLWKFNS